MAFAPTCFGSHRNHPPEAVQYLAKNYRYGSAVLVGMDVGNVNLYTSHTSTPLHMLP
jgi:hypothetical protein